MLVSKLPNTISGRVGREENDNFVIRVNRYEARYCQRFILALELAHVLLHKDLVAAEGGWSHDVLMRSGQPAQIEDEANRLALDPVIPFTLLADAAAEYPGLMTGEVIDDLACRFEVTRSVMEIRLREGIAERHRKQNDTSMAGIPRP